MGLQIHVYYYVKHCESTHIYTHACARTFPGDRLCNTCTNDRDNSVVGAEDLDEGRGQHCVVVLADTGQSLNDCQFVVEQELRERGVRREREIAVTSIGRLQETKRMQTSFRVWYAERGRMTSCCRARKRCTCT